MVVVVVAVVVVDDDVGGVSCVDVVCDGGGVCGVDGFVCVVVVPGALLWRCWC